MKNIRTNSMRYLLTVCVLFSSLVAFAQTTVSGTVVDAALDEPIIGASVRVVGTNTGVV